MSYLPLKLLLVPLSLVLTPCLLICVVFPLYLIRLISCITSKFVLSKNSRILSPISSIFTSDNFSKPRCTLVLAAIVEGSLNKDEIVTRLNLVFNSGLYPELRQKLCRWMGFWFWGDCSDFNLDHHLKFHENTSSSSLVDEVQVRKIRNELVKKEFDTNKPLWEMCIYPYTTIINGHDTNTEPKSVAIFRIHHCVADGYSLLNVFKDFNETEVKTSKPHFLHRTFKQKCVFWLRFLTITPIDLCISYWNAKDNNAFKIKKFSGESFGFEADTVELETLKRIAKKFGVSVSAVIFTGFCAAIRDAFLKKNWPVPAKFHVPCALPVSMKFGESKHLTNVMTLLPFPTPVNEANPLTRLSKIERIFKQKKNSELAVAYSFLFQFAGILASLTRKENGCSSGSAFWSNFPGTTNHQLVFGKKISAFRFTTDFHNDNVALGFASICFNGNMLISCKADKNLFSDPSLTRQFIERVTEEYTFLDKYSFSDNQFV
ncbi:uncharacterized protein LOC118434702 [Folsomia candida]|uniref:uncharacterized protein LOC118434702 n=1 Tax=Folsomia candida TaxID=158441 RepID=UPI00160542B7|nr:uncharacterized protein LOC118434702 [Folsomia candida]